MRHNCCLKEGGNSGCRRKDGTNQRRDMGVAGQLRFESSAECGNWRKSLESRGDSGAERIMGTSGEVDQPFS